MNWKRFEIVWVLSKIKMLSYGKEFLKLSKDILKVIK